MGDRRWARAGVLLVVSFVGPMSVQQPAPWHDPTPHSIQFVTVDDNVKLEVLDWGGSGRPLVFLAGLGNTAHVFDDFAPKLSSEYHVYGITRRGFGASSSPDSGYSADRLGDDVLTVLDALKLNRPVLVGHSIAGEELSSVGSRHPEKVAGLIYLDAAYSYAYYDRSQGDLNIDSHELQRKLDELQPEKGPPDRKLVQQLLQELPEVERDLQQDLQAPQSPPPLAPSLADLESFTALGSWRRRVFGVAYPESELRQVFETTPDGHVGERRAKPTIRLAVIAGEQKYAELRVPALAIYAVPHDPGLLTNNDPVARAAFEDRDAASTGKQAKAFEAGVASARVVRLPHANHYVFISNEANVLREMRDFLASLH
jgi:non-heme chloroperoxidase